MTNKPLLSLLSLLLTALPALAQSQPRLSYVFPPGGRQGTTVEINVRGKFLAAAKEVYISGTGVTGKVLSSGQVPVDPKAPRRLDVVASPDFVKVQLVVEPNAEPGQRDLRILTAGGESNRFIFTVSQVQEITEAESNSTLEQYQALPVIPCVINGQIQQGDRDIFRFKARAGETLVFDLHAQKIVPYIADGVPGWFQPTMTLYDASGREVAFVDDFRHRPDPVLIHKVQSDGEYLVEIRDALFRGRDEFIYRLNIGAAPFITHIFPLGAKRGSKAQVQLFGANLPVSSMTLDLPADSANRRKIQVGGRGVVSNTVPFAADDLTEVLDAEPNNAPDKAQSLAAPCVVNGRIDSPGDVDYFRITVAAKQTLAIKVYARRLESPLDSIVTLYNPKGSQVTENDDNIDRSEGLVTHHADSQITYTFPAAGDYIVRIADTQGRGGQEYAYRLSVAPPQPDYVLRVRPDNPRAPQGGTTFVNVTAIRRDGFDGPIHLAMKGLPEGFSAPAEVIPEKATDARMTLSVAAAAPLGVIPLQVVGTAKIGDRDVVRDALPSEDLMQAFYYMHSVPSRELLLAIIEKGPFTLTLDLPPGQAVRVPRLGRVEFVVKVAFKDGVKPGPITLRPDRTPKEWAIAIEPIEVGKTETTVVITTTGNKFIFAGQRGTLIITASMKTPQGTVTGFVPAIAYEVR